MPDSTRTVSGYRSRARRAAVAVCAALCVGGIPALAGAPAAWADGDPASDVLASQPAFVPGDAGLTPAHQRQLAALLTEASADGYPIRVAIIAGPADLGSVTELWRMPGPYARFLGTELSQVDRGVLLVVMPQGFGVVRVAPDGATPQTGVVAAGALHGPLGTAAEVAVLALARSAGHRLTLPAAHSAPASASALDSVDAGSWLALGVGAALVVGAWAASLRARPLSLRRPT